MRKIDIFSDGGSRGNPGKSACAFVIYEDKKVIFKDSFYLGTKTNNQAEYLGVFHALSWVIKNLKGLHEINYYLDSELVVNQLSGIYKIKSVLIKPLVVKIKTLERAMGIPIKYIHIKRENNKIADKLLNKELDENS